MHRAKEVLKFMSPKTKTTFANSYLFSILNYGAPLMYYLNANIQQGMHTLHMKCWPFTRGNYGFRESCEAICRGVGKKVSSEEFFNACAKFHQRVFFNQQPKQILDKIKLPRTRSSAKIGLKIYAKNKKFKNTCINRIPDFLNKIPDHLRGVKPTIFKIKLKKTTHQIRLGIHQRCHRHHT